MCVAAVVHSPLPVSSLFDRPADLVCGSSISSDTQHTGLTGQGLCVAAAAASCMIATMVVKRASAHFTPACCLVLGFTPQLPLQLCCACKVGQCSPSLHAPTPPATAVAAAAQPCITTAPCCVLVCCILFGFSSGSCHAVLHSSLYLCILQATPLLLDLYDLHVLEYAFEPAVPFCSSLLLYRKCITPHDCAAQAPVVHVREVL